MILTSRKSLIQQLMLLLTPASLLLLVRAPPFASPLVKSTSRVPFEPRCDAPPPSTSEEPPNPAEPARTFSDDWSGAGRFADEDALPLSFWLFGSTPRRAIFPGLVASVVAPAVNLWGSGSFLLSLAPEAARGRRLDTFYPVSSLPRYPYTDGYLDYAPGFQRYYDEQGRFEFRYPASYVQDQSVYLRQAELTYTQRTMDPTLAGAPPSRAPRRAAASGPVVAFGPPGGTGEENLSVVIGSLAPGFSLRGTLGEPAEGAERLLQATIAKAGVRETQLLGAIERRSERSGRPLYQFEYRVDYVGIPGKEPTYTVCVVGSKDDQLYTFASRVPGAVWDRLADALREAASSFALL